MPRDMNSTSAFQENKVELARVRSSTKYLWEGIWDDLLPASMGARVDFGLDGYGGGNVTERFGALQFAVKKLGVTPMELDAALGDGPALTKLVAHPSNAYACVFATAWDDMKDEESEP